VNPGRLGDRWATDSRSVEADVLSIRLSGSLDGLATAWCRGATLGEYAREPVKDLPLVEGLAHEEVGARAAGLAFVVPEGACSERSDRRRRPRGPQPSDDLEPVHPGHPQVHEHDVGVPIGVDRESLRSVGGHTRLEGVPRQQPCDGIPDDVNVIDDEHFPLPRPSRSERIGRRGELRRPLRAPPLRYERELEPAPGSRRALNAEVAAHEPRVHAADGKAEARAAGPHTAIELLEWLEQPRDVLLRDTDARVGDDDLNEGCRVPDRAPRCRDTD